MSPTLAIATVELHLRLDRLERELHRPVPEPHQATTTLDRYDALCRRMRAESRPS